MSTCVLHLHGPPRATLAGGHTVGLAAREAALLARLHLDGPCSRAAMAGFLWPQADEKRARANLRQTLLRLKRDVGNVFLEADGVLMPAPGAQCAPDGDGRLLGPLEFDDAPELAEWLTDWRARAQRDRLREGLQAAQQYVRDGRWDDALARADAVLADDAAVEEAHRIRMQVFLARGDRAAAIGAWDQCRETLRRAFGIQPSASTNELGRRALAAPADAPELPASGATPHAAAVLAGPLVGRDTELATLRDALALGHTAVLSGAGGMGKTSLLHAALGALSSVGAALLIDARPGDEQVPGVLAARLVAAALQRPRLRLDEATRRDLLRLLPGAPQLVAPASAHDHRRALAALTALLRGLRADGVHAVAIDDLQWADALSLEALTPWLGAWLAAPRDKVALPQPLLALRSGEWRPAVRRMVDSLPQGRRSVHISLGPLDAPALARWVQAVRPADATAGSPHAQALAAAMHARVGGNPAFVHDALRALQRQEAASGTRWQPGQPLPLPPNLVESVRERLLALPASSLQLAQLAAVAGPDFSLGLAAAVVGCTPLALSDDFARLEMAEVLLGTGFVHDLVAEAVAASIPANLRAPLHGLVADHLQARGGMPGRLARHRLAAGDRAAAAADFHAAALDARQRWRMADAAEAFEAEAQARDAVTDDGSRSRRLEAWTNAAYCWLNQGQAQRAEAAIETAADLAGDPAEQLQVLAVRMTWLLNSGRYGALVGIARDLTELLPQHEAALDDRALANVLLDIAIATPYVDEPESLLPLLDSVRSRGKGVPRLAARIELAGGMVLNWLGWPGRAKQHLERADALALEHDLQGERINIGNQLARSDEGLGDLESAIRRCQQTLRLARELALDGSFTADLANLRALYEARLGRARQALAALEEAKAALGTNGRPSAYMRLREAMALWWVAETDDARRAAQHRAQSLAVEQAPQAQGPFVAYLCWALATMEAEAKGDPRPWLQRAALSCSVPATLLGLRQRVMRLACGEPENSQVLRDTLVHRELNGLRRVLTPDDASPHAGRTASVSDPWCPPGEIT